ncbi:hypothetical protein T12_5994 [Trichinella patagoniensis]|uniref:Uncharacterized protein n=1 Tax=Trichinella patagoniensis TaxID=990121 RepID=A0A0V0Z6D3_9BILA|nr:hypothetical protein T12_5994 [Trichinella patagoniensis]
MILKYYYEQHLAVASALSVPIFYENFNSVFICAHLRGIKPVSANFVLFVNVREQTWVQNLQSTASLASDLCRQHIGPPSRIVGSTVVETGCRSNSDLWIALRDQSHVEGEIAFSSKEVGSQQKTLNQIAG